MLIKAAAIAILLLSIALAGAGYLLRQAYLDLGEVEQRYETQRQETKKALAQITDLKVRHARQVEQAKTAQAEWRAERGQLNARNQRLRAQSDRLETALEREPVRAGRVASYLYGRGMREICRASGGSKADCRITIPAARPKEPVKAQ